MKPTNATQQPIAMAPQESIHSTMNVEFRVRTAPEKNAFQHKGATTQVRNTRESESARVRETLFKAVAPKPNNNPPVEGNVLGKIAKIGREFNAPFSTVKDLKGKLAKSIGLLGKPLPAHGGGYSIHASERGVIEGWVDKHNAMIAALKPDIYAEYDELVREAKDRMGLNAHGVKFPDADALAGQFGISATFFTEPLEVGQCGAISAIVEEVTNKHAATYHHNVNLHDKSVAKLMKHLADKMKKNAASLRKSMTDKKGRVTQKRVTEIQETVESIREMAKRYGLSESVVAEVSTVFNTITSGIQHVDMASAAPPEREDAIETIEKGAEIVTAAADNIMQW